MTFDKSRVYTALNADELKIGSRCIFADTIQGLRQKVQDENAETYVGILTNLYDDDSVERFESGCFIYIYAYLIEPPKESEYRPFESIEDAMEAIKAHGGWITSRVNNLNYLVTRYGKDDLYIDTTFLDVKELFKCFFFADDGSPCGVLVEE